MPTNPLSVGQEALWFLHDVAPDSAAYNVAFAFAIRDAIDVDALDAAVRRTARRHDMLRSSFADSGDHPVRVVHDDDVTRLRVRRVSADDLTPFVREVIAEPFSLRRPPLVRFVLLRGP
ncbi:condensation domain-containing protein, partial [Actinosynnema sp. NPDC023658]|uniref:condensation domain-containing protein n=1 Tax=Actinosynnema sp. NPDC023658 TaxID=3155465 RepID=UPI0033D3D500